MQGSRICTVSRALDPRTAHVRRILNDAAEAAVADRVRRDHPGARIEADDIHMILPEGMTSDDLVVVEAGSTAPDRSGGCRVLLKVRVPGEDDLREVDGTIQVTETPVCVGLPDQRVRFDVAVSGGSSTPQGDAAGVRCRP